MFFHLFIVTIHVWVLGTIKKPVSVKEQAFIKWR